MPLPLRTDRLLIRPFTPDAAPAMFRVWGDPEVMRYIPGGAVPSEAEVRARLERLAARQMPPGIGLWAIERGEDARVVGMAALIPIAWKGPRVEVAYHLARDCWGRGYATEAAKACVDHGFRELGLPSVVGLTFPENAASQRVLERVGMRRIGTTRAYYDLEMVEFRIERPGTPSGVTPA